MSDDLNGKPLLRGLLLCFTALRLWWLYLAGRHVYEALAANLVGPAVLWMFPFLGVVVLLWGIKRGIEE